MRAEYAFDYSKAQRGRYYERLLKKGSKVVVLDRDVAKAFPDSASVNKALRSFIKSKRPRRAAIRKPKQVSALERARALGLVGAVKGGPRDVAERHSQYLREKLRRRGRRTR